MTVQQIHKTYKIIKCTQGKYPVKMRYTSMALREQIAWDTLIICKDKGGHNMMKYLQENCLPSCKINVLLQYCDLHFIW